MGREEREAAEVAAVAAAEAAAEEAERAAARAAAEEGSGSSAASAAAAAAAAARAKAAAAAAAAAASFAPSSSSASSSAAADTSAPGSETSPRDARRYLAYLRALDAGFRGEYKAWLLGAQEGGSGDGGKEGASAGGLAASLLSTTPAPRGGADSSSSAFTASERPIPKNSAPVTLSVDASPRNAAPWAAGRCLALVEGGDASLLAENDDAENDDEKVIVAFLNVGPLLAALEGMGVSNARIEVEAGGGGGPGAAPLPRGGVLSETKKKKGKSSDTGGDGGEEEGGGGGETLHPSLARTSVELPVTDGSALQWAAEIASVGLVPATPAKKGGSNASSAPAPRTFINVASSSSSGGFISLYPETETSSSPSSAASRVSVGLDAGPSAYVVGSQWLSWSPSSAVGVGPRGGDHFRFSVAPARDWVVSADHLLELRLRHGLYKGGTHGTTLVAEGGEWSETHRCRFVPDEPARNATAAAIGALALLSGSGGVGVPRAGAHVVAFNADAGLWVEFVRKVEAEAGSERVALE